MLSSSARPPLDGSIPVLPGFVDFHAEHNPQQPWAVLSAGPELPVDAVPFSEFARATHRVAHRLRPDKSGPEDEVVAVLVNCDSVLYLALIAGMIRAGLVPFPMSPRNSAPAIINMLKRTSCHRIICQLSLQSLLSSVQSDLDCEKYALQVDALPELEDIFPTLRGMPSDSCEPYPSAPRPFTTDGVVFYLHSSGSTGFPKPIPQRQADMLQTCNASIIVDSAARNVTWGAMALPTFHAMGIYIQLYSPLVSGLPVGLFAPKAPASPVVPTPRNTIEAAMAAQCTGIPTVPTFVEAWAKEKDDVRYLKTLKIVAFAGGPLSSRTGGELIAEGVNLYPWYGGTEFGPHTRVFDIDDRPDPDPNAKTSVDWEWLSFSDRVNCRWVPEGDGTFELQYLTCATHCPNIENLEDIRGYATSDLWQPHPTKKGLWRITGRKDDVIVLGSGEKVVPIPQEGLISSSNMVQGALMFGRGKNQCGILIEPSAGYVIHPNDPVALSKFRNKIWPIVEEANQTAPAFGKIFKEMLIVTDPARPLPRAAKGTIVRKQALALYEREINALYMTVENSGNSGHIAPPASWSVPDVQSWLQKHACALTNGRAILPSKDLFDQSFDSLYATFLRNRIIGALRTDPETKNAAQHVSQNFVFEHPTLHDLAIAISILVGQDIHEGARSKEESIKVMVEEYSANLSRPVYLSTATNGHRGDAVAVLLTGSTGAVGSHILALLLADPDIGKVYTLNRPASVSYDRQQVAFIERGLDPWLLEDQKLVQLIGDLNDDYFGLKLAKFDELKSSVTHVIHNGWKVDFNLSLSSFESNIAGTRKLVDFCCSLSRPAKLLFTSSISATYRWNISLGPVPEELVPTPEVATTNGYGASKFVVEQVLSRAARQGLQCTAIRLGQVCGPEVTGAWSTREWLPIIVKTSISLGVLPDLTGTVSWIPADAVAKTYVDLVLSKDHLPSILNLVHPHPVKWQDIVQSLNSAFGKHPLGVVPYADWLAKVEELPVNSLSMDRFPALKLLQYFREVASGEAVAASGTKDHPMEAGGLPVYSTTRVQRYSPSLRDVSAIGDTHARAWVNYWQENGFLA